MTIFGLEHGVDVTRAAALIERHRDRSAADDVQLSRRPARLKDGAERSQRGDDLIAVHRSHPPQGTGGDEYSAAAEGCRRLGDGKRAKRRDVALKPEPVQKATPGKRPRGPIHAALQGQVLAQRPEVGVVAMVDPSRAARPRSPAGAGHPCAADRTRQAAPERRQEKSSPSITRRPTPARLWRNAALGRRVLIQPITKARNGHPGKGNWPRSARPSHISAARRV